MNRNKKTFVPSTTHYKILETIEELNKNDDYPLPQGVGKILKGIVDEETSKYQSIRTFQTIISYSSKKICRYALVLLRHGYIEKIYDKKTNELYLKISQFGVSALQEYRKKHKKSFVKKKQLAKPTIVRIKTTASK